MDKVKPRTMDMDGTEHEVPGKESCHCASHGRTCEKCGGFAHFQGVYGGIFWRCEDCGYSWS